MKKTITSLMFGVFLVTSAFGAKEEGISKAEMQSLKASYKRPASIPYPKDNQYSKVKYELGKNLFFDPILSATGITSCASCHNPGLHWTDGLPKAVGFKHEVLGRKTPSILNLAWDEAFFWDGRADTLEAQALGPIQAQKEMNLPHEDAITRLKRIDGYVKMFTKAFPGEADPINTTNLAKAIATFERGVVSGKAPFDKWIEGDESAISEDAKKGFVVFNKKGHCSACHSGPFFGDSSFHDIGLPGTKDDLGRGKYVNVPSMQHAFKTTGLRNIAERAPYMPDGSLATLEAVVDHYDHAFVKRESLSSEIKELNLTPEEKKQLVVFMKTLTSVDAPVIIPIVPR